MTAEACREWRERLGAYVLGQLPEEEHAATCAHLEGCAACRAEAESLAPLAGLLSKADPQQLTLAPAPPPELGERIAAQLASRRSPAARRSTRRRWALSLATAGAVAVAVMLALVISSPSRDRGAEAVSFRSLPPGVEIAATLKPRPFGTEIRMQVVGIRSGTLCRVFLRRTDGTKLPAGSFRYRYSDGDDAVLTSALDLSGARAIGVRAGRRTFVATLRGGVGADASFRHRPEEKEYS